MDEDDVSPLEREHSLSVVLPGGQEKITTVHGSKPVMDLLVTLCASHRLNPSDYTVEILSQSNNNISFKPNSPIGLLEAEKLILKPRAAEEKVRAQYMPEATVRLLINYNRSHKAVVRVNPRLPLGRLLPVVCDKCEFEVESTVLLRDSESKEPLDLSRTLNEHSLREVYAIDTLAEGCRGHPHDTAAGFAPNKVSSSSSLQDLTKRGKKKSESKGLFSLFRKNRKKSESSHAVSAPSSPGLKSRSASVSTQDAASCVTPPPDRPKKRHAPLPPMGASNSTPSHLSTCHLQASQRSGEDTLRSTKKRAPPPPPPNHEQDVHVETKDSLKTLDEFKESAEPESVSRPSPPSSPLSPSPPPPSPSSAHPLPKTPDSNRPSIQDARAALAKVLTSSLSTGMMVKRLKNATPFSKVQNDASCRSEDDVEVKSVLNTNLPTENEFEDLADRKEFTTFKVTPSRRESDAEPTQDVPEKEEAKAEPEKPEEHVIPELDHSLKVEDSPDQPEDSPDQLEDSPDQLEDSPDKLEDSPDQLEDSPDQREDSPDQREDSPDQPKDSLDQLKDSLGQLEDSPDKLEDSPDQLEDSPDQPKDSSDQPKDTLDQLKDSLDQLKGSLDQPEDSTDQLEDSLDQLENSPDQPKASPDQSKASPDQPKDSLDQLEDSPDQAEISSLTPCTDEEETTSCFLPLNRSISDLNEVVDVNQTEEEKGETSIADHKVEGQSGQHGENTEGDLYLDEEEVEECHTELDACDSNTCEDEADHFPPPPPPMYFNEDVDEASVSSPGFVTNGHVRPNSEPPNQNAGPPGNSDKPASAPNMFAQAVALAVQRSKLHGAGKTISALVHQDT